MTGGQVFNYDAVLSRLGGDLELFQDLVQFFIEDVPPLLEALREGIKTNDPAAVEQAAHRLKGLIANFSSPTAEEAASGLEKIGRARNLSEAAGLLADLEHEIERLIAALKVTSPDES